MRAEASAVEVLRHRDVASLSSAERARLAAMFARAPAARTTPTGAPPRRRSRRGAVDARKTLREQLRRMGEPGPIAWRRNGHSRRAGSSCWSTSPGR